jgi:hypothetical protein
MTQNLFIRIVEHCAERHPDCAICRYQDVCLYLRSYHVPEPKAWKLEYLKIRKNPTQTDFLEKPQYRDSDPDSSRDAALSMRPHRIANIWRVQFIMQKYDDPITSRELFQYNSAYFEAHRMDKYEIARRLSDLKRIGKVIICASRPCRASKKKHATYLSI